MDLRDIHKLRKMMLCQDYYYWDTIKLISQGMKYGFINILTPLLIELLSIN